VIVSFVAVFSSVLLFSGFFHVISFVGILCLDISYFSSLLIGILFACIISCILCLPVFLLLCLFRSPIPCCLISCSSTPCRFSSSFTFLLFVITFFCIFVLRLPVLLCCRLFCSPVLAPKFPFACPLFSNNTHNLHLLTVRQNRQLRELEPSARIRVGWLLHQPSTGDAKETFRALSTRGPELRIQIKWNRFGSKICQSTDCRLTLPRFFPSRRERQLRQVFETGLKEIDQEYNEKEKVAMTRAEEQLRSEQEKLQR
jgi:hypothetical protein